MTEGGSLRFGGTSRMTRECQVRICERLGVRFPATRLRPGAIFLPAQQISADVCRVQDQNFPYAGDGRVAPDIGPGVGCVRRRQDLDQDEWLTQQLVGRIPFGTG